MSIFLIKLDSAIGEIHSNLLLLTTLQKEQKRTKKYMQVFQ